MAKIEEVTALLVDEIEAFQKSVKELKQENDKIKNTKVKIDAQNLFEILKDFSHTINKTYQKQEKQIEETQKVIQSAYKQPKLVTYSLLLLTFSFILSFGLNILLHKQIDEAQIKGEKEGFKNGVAAHKEYMKPFLNKNPKFKKEFEKWEGYE